MGIEEDLTFQYTNLANMLANRGDFQDAKKYLDIAFQRANESKPREE